MGNHQDITPRIFCIGTADTKLEELRFLSESIRSNLNSFSSNLSSKIPRNFSFPDIPAYWTDIEVDDYFPDAVPGQFYQPQWGRRNSLR